MDLASNEGLRAHAMARLAYTTGLRPGEIARISLDDISFGKGELTVPERKGKNPARFPLPEETVKAMAAYIVGARPENAGRRLFVSLSPPHNPVTGGLVSDAIGKAMQGAGVPGTPYWLRHTYAQNLLESGASIFEIKEMLGHDCIKATKRYLHIHIKLMREVLFDD
jgi:site-specific recombinase XerD